MNKQKTDWDIEFDKHWEFHDSECPIGLTGGGDCKCSVPDIKDFISNLLQQQREDLINKLHAFVCDMATSEQSKSLAKEDCLELIRYQIERIYGKKLQNLKQENK